MLLCRAIIVINHFKVVNKKSHQFLGWWQVGDRQAKWLIPCGAFSKQLK
jgi:hypothetical protein